MRYTTILLVLLAATAIGHAQNGNLPAKTEDNSALRTDSVLKYDFIPGEKILYADDFSRELLAELPAGWNTNGTGEVVTLTNQTGKWLQLHKSSIYLSSNTKEFGDNFTIEFDLILRLKSNGWIFPEINFGVLSSGSLSTTDNSLLRDYGKFASVTTLIQPGSVYPSRLNLESKQLNKLYFRGVTKDYKELSGYYNKPVHIAMQVQKERFRCWINEVKAFDAPKAVPADSKMNQFFLKISPTNYAEQDYGIYFSNIKVATGIPDTRQQLLQEGKYSTTGINFDLNAATLKPESAGVIKEIAAVLIGNAGMKIKVTGHTSSEGDDAFNLLLSEKRAVAVKEALVNNHGIDPSRIFCEGKGEAQPVADNNTREGKVQNRRVEFTRI